MRLLTVLVKVEEELEEMKKSSDEKVEKKSLMDKRRGDEEEKESKTDSLHKVISKLDNFAERIDKKPEIDATKEMDDMRENEKDPKDYVEKGDEMQERPQEKVEMADLIEKRGGDDEEEESKQIVYIQ